MVCAVKDCKDNDIEVIFYGKPVCFKHWESHCNPNGRTDLKKEFKIPVSDKIRFVGGFNDLL